MNALRRLPPPIVVALAGLVAGCSEPPRATLQGYVEGEFVRIAAPYAGALETLAVQRGQQVAAGDPLFSLQNENEAAARREAGERLANARAQLANLEKARRPSEIDAVVAQLAQAEAAVRLSTAELKRTEALVADNFVSRARLDEARSAVERDRARVQQLQAELRTARLGAREDEVKAARATVAAAQAAVEQAQWRLAQKSVRAPVAGVVADTLYVRGDWVAAGAPVVSVLPPANVKVRFFVAEEQLGRVAVGQQAHVRCDGCTAPVVATVSYVAPQAEFTPPVIYSRDSRHKLVYLVEARPDPPSARLHPGQPVDVELADVAADARR